MTDHLKDIIHARFEDCKAFVKVEQARLLEQRVEQVIMSYVDDLAHSIEARFIERIRTQLLPQISSISQECLEEAVRTSMEVPTEEGRPVTNMEPITYVANRSPSDQDLELLQGSHLSSEMPMASTQTLFDFELDTSLLNSSSRSAEAPYYTWEDGGASFPTTALPLEEQFDHGYHQQEQGLGQRQEESELSSFGVVNSESDDFDSLVYIPGEA
jgi:hypothetical protein